MAARRGTDEPRLLAAGPGRLCQALGITGEQDGAPLDRPPFELYAREEVEVERGLRIGITKAADRPWRYAEAGSRFLSRPITPRPAILTVIPGAAATPARGSWKTTRPGTPCEASSTSILRPRRSHLR